MPGELKAAFAPLPRTARGQPIVLNGRADKKTFLYVHGSNVFLRNIENPMICDVYTEHSKTTTVAQYSPSGFYIASADTIGKVRIWDTVNVEHVLKNEFQPLSGSIKDLCWSGDNQRIVVGGEGREKYAHVFNADTGTSVGEVTGQSKSVNAVSFKQDRPFRIATASEDQTLCFFEGPPFKYHHTIHDHKNFVNCVRYSPNSQKFVSGGADGRAFVYDGKTGEKVGELGDPAHKGGIYGVSFSSNSLEVLTVSADKTAKIWNMENFENVCQFTLGTALLDMQVGCLWLGDFILTVSLSGNINYLDRSNPSSPSQIIKGHNKQIEGIIAAGDTLYSADSEGKICVWDANTGTCTEVTGKGHSVQIKSISLMDDKLITCAIDDTVKVVDLSSQSYSDISIAMGSQPQCVATSADGHIVVACLQSVNIIQNGQLLFKQDVKYEPKCVAIHPSQSEIAVGGGQDSKIHIYSLTSGTLQETKTLSAPAAVTCVSYSPDGAYLAAGSERKVLLYSGPEYEVVISTQWVSHTARVMCLSWSPNSQHVASGSLDTDINIWDVNNHAARLSIKKAHKMSVVSSLSWRSDNELVSAGHDSIVQLWNISF
ncbi:WDR1 [Bugula neritina]|uniref:Actin-interacting protein 1 n=1 Tax=Bugula neritina TaxID=10212 RepID=A0A7J7J689_BUGNE|nr:WDR1 [Bugula neritina]